MTINLTADQQAYLADQMKKVSRTFALVAPTIEEPLNDHLATAYLICRVVDNIEDCTQPFPWQQQRFAEFATLLEDPGRALETLTRWESEAWPGLTRDETKIMGVADGLMLWQIYAQIPERPRASIARWALEMARGMEQFVNPNLTDFFFSRDGVRLPSSEDDYDRYCFYVAGTVGHMITEMAIGYYGLEGETADRLLINSEASGRALQKTNIIKDFAKDLQRGTCFLPDEWLQEVNYAPLSLAGAPFSWKEKVVANVVVEFDNSVNYILDLPHSALGFRKASLLMLLPGYQTLILAARNLDRLFTPAHHVKISRKTMAKCMLDARMIVKNDDAIRAYSRNARAELSKAFASDRIKTHT